MLRIFLLKGCGFSLKSCGFLFEMLRRLVLSVLCSWTLECERSTTIPSRFISRTTVYNYRLIDISRYIGSFGSLLVVLLILISLLTYSLNVSVCRLVLRNGPFDFREICQKFCNLFEF